MKAERGKYGWYVTKVGSARDQVQPKLWLGEVTYHFSDVTNVGLVSPIWVTYGTLNGTKMSWWWGDFWSEYNQSFMGGGQVEPKLWSVQGTDPLFGHNPSVVISHIPVNRGGKWYIWLKVLSRQRYPLPAHMGKHLRYQRMLIPTCTFHSPCL